MLDGKQALLDADVRGRCPHLIDPLNDPWFGRIKQGDGVAVMCRGCFADTRIAVVSYMVLVRGKEQHEAEQFFAERSLLASELED